MKFSHQLMLNCVPDWAEYYISYSNLKKLIYSIERQHAQTTLGYADLEAQPDSPAQTQLLSPNAFVHALDTELDRIVGFYLRKEKELTDAFEALKSDIVYMESSETAFGMYGHRSSTRPSLQNLLGHDLSASITEEMSDDHNDHTAASSSREPLLKASSVPSSPNSPHNHNRRAMTPPPQQPHRSSVSTPTSARKNLWATRPFGTHRTKYVRRIVDMYVCLKDLQDYADLNRTGFSKILKKYDKITGNALRASYLSTVIDVAYPYREENKEKLQERLDETEQYYARLVHSGDHEAALADLKNCLREHITYERNTVWRDMISHERKVLAIGVAKDDERRNRVVSAAILGHSFQLPRIESSWVYLVLTTIVFVVLLNVRIFETEEQQNCFAILVFASLSWATEALPLFVTSLLIPMLVIMCRVMRDPTTAERLDTHSATKAVFAAMFSPVIMLLLGGFSIAAALSKHHIAKKMATALLSHAGTKAVWVLLANMMVATFASMWISNVAAPVLCFSLIQPILRTLPQNSTFAQALILGIALASNIGGMASPISSPQNVIAIENMEPAPSWIEWFAIAIPLSIIANLITWMILLVVYSPHVSTPEILPLRATGDKLSGKQIFILLVTGLTILLWCLESSIEGIVGDMGVIAIFPIVVFFGFGILTKEDFNNFLWTVIMLAMGGIALGKAVENSGLLRVIALHIQDIVSGYSAWMVLLVFSSLMLVVATFISHTVAALIVLPVVREVGNSLPDPHARMLVMGAALMCSGAMGLPVSGFPNMNAISQEDATGKPYLRSVDFIKAGVPGSIGVWLAIISVGYGIMSLLHF
ncbi:low-affinity phosphate transporter [Sorochytrium milnesiophthora]